jgi:hypothetical protein
VKNITILIITGLSGSGKSTAMAALEDAGFYCIDNMPVGLLPKFLEMPMEPDSEITGIALVMDLRERGFLAKYSAVFNELKQKDIISKFSSWKLKKKSCSRGTVQHAGSIPCLRRKVCWTAFGLKKNSWKT